MKKALSILLALTMALALALPAAASGAAVQSGYWYMAMPAR